MGSHFTEISHFFDSRSKIYLAGKVCEIGSQNFAFFSTPDFGTLLIVTYLHMHPDYVHVRLMRRM